MSENPYAPPEHRPTPEPAEPGMVSYFAIAAVVILLTLFFGYLIDQMVH